MKAHFFRAWKIIFCVLIALTLWSCSDPPNDAEKTASVRKKVVLPEEKTPQEPLQVASEQPVESQSPAALKEQSPSQESAQSASVTKKIPDVIVIPVQPEDNKPIDIKKIAPEQPAPAVKPPRTAPVEMSENNNKPAPEKKPAEAQRPQTAAAVDADVSEEATMETASLPDDLPVFEGRETPADEEEADRPPEEKAEAPETSTGESRTTDAGVSDSALASILGIAREETKTKTGYDPSGRVDPFEPLFKPPQEEETPPEEQPVEGGSTADKPKREKRIPRTPLEKMDLNQLKLVGVIRAESGNRALVQESSGKGYIISKGTYIGIHSGKVAEILKDRIIVEEEYEDIRGEITVRERELKIQKPPGEGYHEM